MENSNDLEFLLRAELKSFGLNPYEWTLKKASMQNFLVLNKTDEKFILVGQVEYKKKQPKWKFLSLESI